MDGAGVTGAYVCAAVVGVFADATVGTSVGVLVGASVGAEDAAFGDDVGT